MNLRQLEAFRATMLSGSITGASRLLHISQPSVSRLIADLERSLGFALFTRSGRGLVSTVEGRRFQQSVETMFIGLDKLEETAEAIRTTKDESVSLGTIPVFAASITPDAISRRNRRQADFKLEVSVKNTPDIVDAILLQQMDLGIICPTRKYEEIHVIYETTVVYRCLVPHAHSLATSRVIDLRELNNAALVTLEPSYPEQVCETPSVIAGLKDNIRIISHSDLAISAIAQAMGILAIVDPYTASITAKTGSMLSLPIKQRLEYPIQIIARSEDSLSLGATRFAQALMEEFANEVI